MKYCLLRSIDQKKVVDCILPDSIKITFQQYVDQKTIPNLMLCGSAGTGKCLDPNEQIEVMMSEELYSKFIEFKNK